MPPYARAGTTDCFDRRLDPWERFDPLPSENASSEARATRAALDRSVAAHSALEPRWKQGDAAKGEDQIRVEPERVEKLRELG